MSLGYSTRSEAAFKRKVLKVTVEHELEEDLDNELRNVIEPNKNLRGRSYFDAISQVVDKCPKFSLPKTEDIDNVSWLETAYEYAALKNKVSQATLNVDVPDTVLLKYQRPYAWFHSEDAVVRKKVRVQELTPEAIVRHFNRGAKPNEIVAYFLAIRHNRRGEESPTVEYFDAAELEHFLVNRMKNIPHSGILQKFIQPPGNHNAMIRAWWTPHKCVLESRCNSLHVADASKGLKERAVTFDGEEYQTEARIIKTGKLYRRTQDKCEEIKNHMETLLPHGYKVWLMVLYFKVGDNNKLWWLWCGSTRLQNRKGVVTTKPRPLTPKETTHAIRKPQPKTAKLDKTKHRFENIVGNLDHPHADESKCMLTFRAILLHFYPQHFSDKVEPADSSSVTIDDIERADKQIPEKAGADKKKTGGMAEVSQEPLAVLKNFRRKSQGGPDAAADKTLPSQNMRDRMILKVLLKDPSRPLPVQMMPFLRDDIFLSREIEVCESWCLDFMTTATNSMMLTRRGLLPRGPDLILPPAPSPHKMHIYDRLSKTVDYSLLSQNNRLPNTKLPSIQHKRGVHTSMDGEVARINRKDGPLQADVGPRSKSTPLVKPGSMATPEPSGDSKEPSGVVEAKPGDEAEAENIAAGILPAEAEAMADESAAEPEHAAEPVANPAAEPEAAPAIEE